MNLNDQEALAFLTRMFPGGLKAPDLMVELCPEGWEHSPLFACYHPSPEVRDAESLKFSRNLKRLALLGRKRKTDTAANPPDASEPPFEELLTTNQSASQGCSKDDAIEECAELFGLCLWDIFSDNHQVIAADGRTVDLGSFRGSAGMIADFFETSPDSGDDPVEESWSTWDRSDYMRFYLGTGWLAQRADLEPVYRLIFHRLKLLGGDWEYTFPQLHLIDLDSRQEDASQNYDPSASFALGEKRDARAEELRKMRQRIDDVTRAAKREARRNEPPTTVRAYQEVFRSYPKGWPPDPYPAESES